MASKYRTVAPEGLKPPEYSESWLGRRDECILDHGFSADQLGLEWWHRALDGAGLSQFAVAVDPVGGGSGRLKRSDLFELGRRATSDDAILTFYFHVLAWGSGKSRRHNSSRITAFRERADRNTNVRLLREAIEAARQGTSEGTRIAYSALIRSGGGKIPTLGPAFFTKILYFAGAGEGEVPCSILDARVAKSLYHAGWGSIPRTSTARGNSYSYNWYTDTYVSYCELLARWASARSTDTRPDEFERALFEGTESTG